MDGRPTDGLTKALQAATVPGRSRYAAHLVGICGAGMKALAEVLIEMGWSLSGSDLSQPSPAIRALCERGLQFHVGHHAHHVPEAAQCLIYSPAVPSLNPERIEAACRNLPEFSYSQMVGRFLAERQGVCIAGTHGKSTTTAMVGWILTHAGADPSVIVGAELCTNGLSGRFGLGPWAIVESCEFNYSFLDFRPVHGAITNIESDHFDCYPDLSSAVRSFATFANSLPEHGVLLANGNCQSSREAVREARARVVLFGSSPDCDWQATQVVHTPAGSEFGIIYRGSSRGRVTLTLHGEHNVQNALAAAAICFEMGISADAIKRGLGSFGGVKRRFEVIGECNGLTLIDDYAHHPTAVRACLKTARDVYGSRRIWVAFQPHQVSRTTALMSEFAASFDNADEVVILPVFAARERVTDQPVQCSQELARRIAARGRRCRFVESLDRILTTVDDAARPGDVLIAMGAGDIDRIHHEFIRSIC